MVMMMEKIKLSKIAMKQVSAMPGGSTVPWYICMYRVYPPYLSLLCLLHPRLDVVHLHAFTFVYPVYKYLPWCTSFTCIQ